MQLISEMDFQDYLSRYQDLRDEWKKRYQPKGQIKDITDDVVFEIELLKQIEINIDYILMLVNKYHDENCQDKEVLVQIRKTIDASPDLRSKKELIESFITRLNDSDDVDNQWATYIVQRRSEDLKALVEAEKLNEEETRKYLSRAFRDGELKVAGTAIDKILPPVSRFGKNGRAEKMRCVIEKLRAFFEKYCGIGGSSDSF